VRLERIENSRYTAINERGGKISIGTGDGTDFSPVELLLVSIGGCTAVDVDLLTSRRAEPDSFEIVVTIVLDLNPALFLPMLNSDMRGKPFA